MSRTAPVVFAPHHRRPGCNLRRREGSRLPVPQGLRNQACARSGRPLSAQLISHQTLSHASAPAFTNSRADAGASQVCAASPDPNASPGSDHDRQSTRELRLRQCSAYSACLRSLLCTPRTRRAGTRRGWAAPGPAIATAARACRTSLPPASAADPWHTARWVERDQNFRETREWPSKGSILAFGPRHLTMVTTGFIIFTRRLAAGKSATCIMLAPRCC